MTNINRRGSLYIVATPIGNLKDITLRAIEVLQDVNCIAAEDTRHSQHLLTHLTIKKPLISLHDYNEAERTTQLIHRLQQGESIALISDAGTPLISDPGYFLVKEVKNAGFEVIPIPGPCAAIAALSAAGLPTDRFVFEGFLPGKPKARLERLEALVSEARTLIFYEAPHRIISSLQAMQQVFGQNRQMVYARELTKKFEVIRSGTLADMTEWISQDENQQRGEIIVLVAGVEEVSEVKNAASADKVLAVLLEALPLKQATELAAKITGQRKNALYQQALTLNKK